MESKFHFIGAGISLAIGISILACGGGTNTGGGDPCTFDSECSIGQVCSQDLNVCEETCVDSNDCFAGESCLPRLNADGNTCQFDSTGGDTDMGGGVTPGACTENEECIDGVDGVCFQGMCDYPTPDETTYRWIMIADESSGDDACDQTDPGSDIMGVRLLDESGQLIGWGDAGNESLGTSGSKTNKYDTTARLDGQPNGLSSQSCPESGSRLSELTPPPLSLGCGGWVLINFLDTAGTAVDIENGHRIEVLEYGSTCGGSAFDKYSVYICEETASAQGGSESTCNLGVGGQTEGFGSVTVDI